MQHQHRPHLSWSFTGVHVDDDLTGTGFQRRAILDHQLLWRTQLATDDRAHGQASS